MFLLLFAHPGIVIIANRAYQCHGFYCVLYALCPASQVHSPPKLLESQLWWARAHSSVSLTVRFGLLANEFATTEQVCMTLDVANLRITYR